MPDITARPLKEEVEIVSYAYSTLHKTFGRQHWWGATPPFEVLVSAILVQRTSWRNARAALDVLKAKGLLSAQGLASIGEEDLARAISASGLHRQKAASIRRLSRLLVERFKGDAQRFLRQRNACETLLTLKGVGGETADTMLLYAGGRLALPVGEYTRRTLVRLGLSDRGYGAWQRLIQASLPRRVKVYRDFHALFVAHGKRFCRKTPKCSECPLLSRCPFGRRFAAR